MQESMQEFHSLTHTLSLSHTHTHTHTHTLALVSCALSPTLAGQHLRALDQDAHQPPAGDQPRGILLLAAPAPRPGVLSFGRRL
jgi:hypothetical protein